MIKSNDSVHAIPRRNSIRQKGIAASFVAAPNLPVCLSAIIQNVTQIDYSRDVIVGNRHVIDVISGRKKAGSAIHDLGLLRGHRRPARHMAFQKRQFAIAAQYGITTYGLSLSGFRFERRRNYNQQEVPPVTQNLTVSTADRPRDNAFRVSVSTCNLPMTGQFFGRTSNYFFCQPSFVLDTTAKNNP